MSDQGSATARDLGEMIAGGLRKLPDTTAVVVGESGPTLAIVDVRSRENGLLHVFDVQIRKATFRDD